MPRSKSGFTLIGNKFRHIPKALGALALGVCALPALADIPDSERAVLNAIYNSTGGADWFDATGWSVPASQVCSDTGDSSWLGVSCSADGTHVTGVILTDNSLAGTLPALTDLTNLTVLSVDDNQLTGNLPSLSGMQFLDSVQLQGNQFSGSMPAFDNLPALTLYRADDNQLTGDIPDLSNLTALETFYVNGNQLTGVVPDLSALTALQGFNVADNKLSNGSGPLAVLPPASLVPANTSLCDPDGDANGLIATDAAVNTAWNTATGLADWHIGCKPSMRGPTLTTATTSVNLTISVDNAATLYYEAIASTATCPAAGDASYSAGVSVTASGSFNQDITGLTANTAYNLCYYAQNTNLAHGTASNLATQAFTTRANGGGAGATSVPTLGETALALLAALLGVSAAFTRTRRRGR